MILTVMWRSGGALTLEEVKGEQQQEDSSGGHLDPPSEEEREEDDADNALTRQRRPGAFGLGFGKRRALKVRHTR